MLDQVADVCANPTDHFPWSEWKDLFRLAGVTAIDDDSGVMDSTELTSEQAKDAARKCTVKIEPIQEPEPVEDTLMGVIREAAPELSPTEWAHKLSEMRKVAPIGEIIRTADGSDIQVSMSIEKGKPPIFWLSIYLPVEVCGPLIWLAKGKNTRHSGYWRALLTPRSRDEALSHFDLESKYGYVKAVRIVREAFNSNALICEVVEW